ncbi:MAG: 30S ribosomal protein S17e [Zestosphaera tikiterensis]|uniref:Small ribosomal subunit protein eS17 n=1 Tax=Zestosphaera tikiterensis TaxID=1973259 RepID=A0A2R7Y6G5_9CREN|nr:MAG: 30S ribosomal protein S17e [Zestosphaera tikiterensis]
MGRVRTSIVKRTARRLLELYPSEVSKDFEENKKLVSKYVYVRSKKLRNKIAGYLTHLVKIKEKLEKASAAKAEA